MYMNSNYLAYSRRDYMKNYYKTNKLKCKLSQLRWREKNRAYIREYMKEYMKTYRKIPLPYKGRKGFIKLEKKTYDSIRFIHKPVTITF